MKRIITVLAAATLGLGLATAGSTSAQGAVDKAPGSKSVHDGYTPPPIRWGPCHDATLDSYGAKCGMLVVPLNYARPHGKKIEVAVSRVKQPPRAIRE